MELTDFQRDAGPLELYELREAVASPMGPFRLELVCDLDGEGPPGRETLREAERLRSRFRRDAAGLTQRVHVSPAWDPEHGIFFRFDDGAWERVDF